MMATLLLAFAILCQNPMPATEVELDIQISGQKHLTKSALIRAAAVELDVFRFGDQRRSALDDAAFLMEEAYRHEGFPEAQVDWELDTLPNRYRAHFYIHEGKALLLGTLHFPGAKALQPEQLAGLLGLRPDGKGKHPFRRSELEGMASAIRESYWQLGYLETTVAPPEFLFEANDTRRGARFTIVEGTGYVLHQIRFLEPGPLGQGEMAELVAPLLGLPYFPRRQTEAAQLIRRRYAKAAFPDAKVRLLETRDPLTGLVHLVITVDPGVSTVLSGLEFPGAVRTDVEFLRQRLGVEVGEPYDREKLDSGFLRLFRTGLFRSIKMDLGPGSEGPFARPLIVTLEENPAKELSFRSGYGSYEGFRTGFSFLERNLFGSGRRFRAGIDASQVGWAAEVGWTDPWLFGSEVALDLPVYIRRRREPSFTHEEFGFGWSLDREYTPNFRLGGGWAFRRSNVSAVTVSTGPEVVAADFDIASFFIQPEYDSRNDFFNPSSGSLATLRVEWAGDHLLGGEVAFLRTRLNLSHLLPLDAHEERVLALAWRSGLVFPMGTTERIPLQERFFNGGEDSVRSFREGDLGPLDSGSQPLGGESFHTVNIELRQMVKDNLWASAFVDAGNVGLRPEDVFEDLRWGIGSGLRYLLPVGALRLDFAWNPDTRDAESSYQVFLTVGMAF